MSKYIIPTTATGNCAYCAVAIGREICKAFKESADSEPYYIMITTVADETTELRQEAADWLSDFDKVLTCNYNLLIAGVHTRRDVVLDVVNEEDYESDLDDDLRCAAYIEKMRADREWACLAEIYAMACILSTRIEIFHVNMEPYAIFEPPGSTQTIKLVFHPYGEATHYSVWLDEEDYYALVDYLPTARPLHVYLASVGAF